MMSDVALEKEFQSVVTKRSRCLLMAADCFSKGQLSEDTVVRPLLGELLSKSIQVKEFLDECNAQNNSKWCQLRSLTAAVKMFSEVGYELLHIRQSLDGYRLLDIEHDFSEATSHAIAFIGGALLRSTTNLVETARKLGVGVPAGKSIGEDYAEYSFSGKLLQDRKTREADNVCETVTFLSTAFLNLAAESKIVHIAGRADSEEYKSFIPEPISEKSLRDLQFKFHSLQSLYDTYVSKTDTEVLDNNLPILRGHISVVFHLLSVATSMAHYYERHIGGKMFDCQQLIDRDELLLFLMDYSLYYASCYIECAKNLCQNMLKQYSEVGSIEVKVPQYRGFHVRPSTLISKLVLHYGSEIRMELEGQYYDVSSPLEIFRANEGINARKRTRLAEEIAKLEFVNQPHDGVDVKTVVRHAVMMLAEQSKLILYEQPLQFPPQAEMQTGLLLGHITDEIAKLLAMGKIDIDSQLMVKFSGDKRVLEDIKLLADAGYGEDNFGNNIALPEKLAYLRR